MQSNEILLSLRERIICQMKKITYCKFSQHILKKFSNYKNYRLIIRHIAMFDNVQGICFYLSCDLVISIERNSFCYDSQIISKN